jgi:hypothetical protein
LSEFFLGCARSLPGDCDYAPRTVCAAFVRPYERLWRFNRGEPLQGRQRGAGIGVPLNPEAALIVAAGDAMPERVQHARQLEAGETIGDAADAAAWHFLPCEGDEAARPRPEYLNTEIANGKNVFEVQAREPMTVIERTSSGDRVHGCRSG